MYKLQASQETEDLLVALNFFISLQNVNEHY